MHKKSSREKKYLTAYKYIHRFLMPCQIEDTGIDVSNIFPVMIGSNDNGYCLENNDSRVL